MLQRADIEELESGQLEQFLLGLADVQKDPGKAPESSVYSELTGLHGLHCQHFNRLFLPWHRAYIKKLEDAVVARTGGMMGLPYWNWFRHDPDKDPPEVFTTPELFGRANPLYVKRSDYIRHRADLPRGEESHAVLESSRTWALFGGAAPPKNGNGSLEGIHNLVHNWVSSLMAETHLAACDPMFWHVHSFVDLLWDSYQGTPGKQPENQAEWDEVLPGMGEAEEMRVRDVARASQLGYEYVVKSYRRRPEGTNKANVLQVKEFRLPAADYGLVRFRFVRMGLPEGVKRMSLHVGRSIEALGEKPDGEGVVIPTFGFHTKPLNHHEHAENGSGKIHPAGAEWHCEVPAGMMPGERPTRVLYMTKEEVKEKLREATEPETLLLESVSTGNGPMSVDTVEISFLPPARV